jgi:acyl-coenzyme A thioesterase PaaI-like protein
VVDQAGRRFVFVGVDVFDRDGRLCARCRGTMAASARKEPTM